MIDVLEQKSWVKFISKGAGSVDLYVTQLIIRLRNVHIDKKKSFVFYRINQLTKFPPHKSLDEQT